MSTVSLQMIVKDEVEHVVELVEAAYPYFSEVNLTVSDKTAANKLKKLLAIEANVKWREWTDDFAAARNANYAMSTTDYTFWLDADDNFDFSCIPELVRVADDNNIDAIFLPYNYARDDQGNVITKHYRERLVRRGRGYEWRGVIHETYITDEKTLTHIMENPVEHYPGPDHASDSRLRNHDILVKLCEGKNYEEVDPRYLFYLGMSHFGFEQYNQCIEVLLNYLKVGGSVEDSYRALQFISEAAYHLGKHDLALEYATKCATLKPEYPQAYYLLAQYEADQSNWKEALEWVKVSETKPDPRSLSVYDPTARERATLLGAQAEFMLGHYNRALAYLRKIPNNPHAKELIDSFVEEADAETFVQILPKIRKFFTSDVHLWEALCQDMKYDSRLRQLRNVATEPIRWSDKSIVIFCGQGYEEWGPHTLDKGMGGSEEAVVYLSHELAKRGWRVTVFGEYESKGETLVDWHHWREIDLRDEFNVFVSWRAPQFLEKVNAKVKLADIHDVLPKEVIKDYPDVTYLFKTQYHKALYGPVNSAVIGNGIKKEQFKENQ